MPPIFALFLYFVLVFFLLYIDRKKYPDTSIALWIPTIWMLLTFSKPLSIWFNIGGETIEEGSPLDRAYLIAMLGIGLIILVKRRLNWSGIFKDNFCLFFLVGYMLVSCLWSDIPYLSLKRWTRELVALVMAFLVATELDPIKALESLLRRIIYVLIPLSYLLINYFSEYGRMYVHHSGDLMWVGAALHKNTLAQLCLFASIFIIWNFIRNRQEGKTNAFSYESIANAIILFLAIWLWGGPQHTPAYSATATMAFILGLITLVVLFRTKKRSTMPGPIIFILPVILIFIYGTITPMIGGLSLFDVSTIFGREQTLTGRTDVWSQLIPIAMSQPILGHGFSSFWTTETRDVFKISGSHNGYLDLILELGLMGLLICLVFYVSNIRNAQRVLKYNFDWGVLWISLIVITLISNIAESSLNSFTTRLTTTILFLTASFTISTKKK